jgi:hypothetical protein
MLFLRDDRIIQHPGRVLAMINDVVFRLHAETLSTIA